MLRITNKQEMLKYPAVNGPQVYQCNYGASKLFPKAGTNMQRSWAWGSPQPGSQCLLSSLNKLHLGAITQELIEFPKAMPALWKVIAGHKYSRTFAPYSLRCGWTFSQGSIPSFFCHRGFVWVSKQLQGLSARVLAASLLLMFCGRVTQGKVRS